MLMIRELTVDEIFFVSGGDNPMYRDMPKQEHVVNYGWFDDVIEAIGEAATAVGDAVSRTYDTVARDVIALAACNNDANSRACETYLANR